MEIAELFVVGQEFDPDTSTPATEALRTEFARDEGPDATLRQRLLAEASLVEHAAAVADFVLRGFDVDAGQRRAVHDLATLAFAASRAPERLVDPTTIADPEVVADLAALPDAIGGNTEAACGPLSHYAASIGRGLAQGRGWELGGEALSDRLREVVTGLGQEIRMHEFTRNSAFGPTLAAATRGAWQEALAQAGCVVAGDDSRVVRSSVADQVGRLLAGVVGLARELGVYLQGEGDARAVELVTQRFAVPSHVVKLTGPQIARSLRATLELEVRDLLDAVAHLDPASVRATVVRRLGLAVVTVDGSAHAVVAATSAQAPNQAEVMEMMQAIARADGKITADERALLRGFDGHLHDFADLVRRVEEDRRVDFEEFAQLRQMRQRILDDMFRIALADADVSDDERQLLLRAMELLPTLRATVPTA